MLCVFSLVLFLVIYAYGSEIYLKLKNLTWPDPSHRRNTILTLYPANRISKHSWSIQDKEEDPVQRYKMMKDSDNNMEEFQAIIELKCSYLVIKKVFEAFLVGTVPAL
jgi:hypothetical protein